MFLTILSSARFLEQGQTTQVTCPAGGRVPAVNALSTVGLVGRCPLGRNKCVSKDQQIIQGLARAAGLGEEIF